MPSPRAQLVIFMAVLAAITLSVIGCSRGYRFRVEGAVRNAADGEPVRGANVRLRGPYGFDGGSVTSGDGGSFVWVFDASESELRRYEWDTSSTRPQPWTLDISADGFLDESVDITPSNPDHLCAGKSGYTAIIVRVYLRPAPSDEQKALQ